MKDEAIKKLRRTVDDQTLLIQSLRFNSSEDDRPNHKKISIMSEISEYVRTHGDEGSRPSSAVGGVGPDASNTHVSPLKSPASVRATPATADTPADEMFLVSPSQETGVGDLGVRMSFYASALQQIADGKQLVTRESASLMSLDKLKRTASVLTELVESKSEQLLQAFQVRYGCFLSCWHLYSPKSLCRIEKSLRAQAK